MSTAPSFIRTIKALIIFPGLRRAAEADDVASASSRPGCASAWGFACPRGGASQ
jgi:hypothetical protein